MKTDRETQEQVLAALEWEPASTPLTSACR
jgi:hypothetical protein